MPFKWTALASIPSALCADVSHQSCTHLAAFSLHSILTRQEVVYTTNSNRACRVCKDAGSVSVPNEGLDSYIPVINHFYKSTRKAISYQQGRSHRIKDKRSKLQVV